MFRLRSNQQQQIQSTKSNKICIQNIDADTTEEDLFEVLAEWDPVIIYIPYEIYTGLRNYHPKSYGKAFVVFKNIESATYVVENLNGTWYKDKLLNIDYHIPYSPEKSRKKPQRRDDSSDNETRKPNKRSEDTIYCGALPVKCTEMEISNIFNPYHPIDINFIETQETSHFFKLAHPECFENGVGKSVLVKFRSEFDIDRICKEVNRSTGWGKASEFRPALIQDANVDGETYNPSN